MPGDLTLGMNYFYLETLNLCILWCYEFLVLDFIICVLILNQCFDLSVVMRPVQALEDII